MCPPPMNARTTTTEQLVAELRRPEAYAHMRDLVGAEIEFLQTHISLLFFAGDRVYKLKKPVDLGFLDFTTLERRQHFCREEVRLNRRLAPEVYVGVVPVTRTAEGRLAVGGQGGAGQVVEWAVEMLRLPEQRMLSNLLARGEIDNAALNELAQLLSEFHAGCPTGPDVDEHGTADALRANVAQNLEQLEPFVNSTDRPSSGPGSGLRVLSPAQHAFLGQQRARFFDTHTELLERRIREGRIREGHGDLHAGNICFAADGPIAYDCIEFSRRFRCGDVALDLAFLAMDLDYRGFPAFAGYLVKRYASLCGDSELRELIPTFKSYRAVVRAKVAALTSADPALETRRREELRLEAMRYLQLGAAYELPPAMILMCGLPASGKSWLAPRLARPLRAAVLHSDVRRKTMAGVKPTTRVKDDYESGLYSPQRKRATYRSLLEDAIEGLQAGHSVIVDATFSRRAYRSEFVDAAARLGLPYYVVHVTSSDEVVRERLVRREREGRSASDADLAVYLREKESFEPPTETPSRHVLEAISGEGIPEEQSSIVIDRMIALRDGE